LAHRWRGRRAGLAIIVIAIAGGASAVVATEATGSGYLTVTDAGGTTIARVALPHDGSFALRYRNSLYGTAAEERFRVEHGDLVLISLAAEELAVLEEYYAIRSPAVRDEGGDLLWRASPADDVRLPELRVAATDLGRRTLIVSDTPPIRLWELVEDRAPTVRISVQER